jgi:hypothetical protein
VHVGRLDGNAEMRGTLRAAEDGANAENPEGGADGRGARRGAWWGACWETGKKGGGKAGREARAATRVGVGVVVEKKPMCPEGEKPEGMNEVVAQAQRRIFNTSELDSMGC